MPKVSRSDNGKTTGVFPDQTVTDVVIKVLDQDVDGIPVKIEMKERVRWPRPVFFGRY